MTTDASKNQMLHNSMSTLCRLKPQHHNTPCPIKDGAMKTCKVRANMWVKLHMLRWPPTKASSQRGKKHDHVTII